MQILLFMISWLSDTDISIFVSHVLFNKTITLSVHSNKIDLCSYRHGDIKIFTIFTLHCSAMKFERVVTIISSMFLSHTLQKIL